MVDLGTDLNSDWVCPNNRQLALRAKLQIGWSMKMQQLRQYGNKWKPLDENEQQIIANVVQRAEALENVEQERIGRLVERLENMKRNMMGTGVNQCILCGDRFGLLGSTSMICYDCRKAVCPKCGIETSSSRKDSVWLCKICAETREIWKKSGAWFYKGIPKYVIPPKKNNDSKYAFKRRIIGTGVIEKSSWPKPSSSPSNFLKAMEEKEKEEKEKEKEKTQEKSAPTTPERVSLKGYERSAGSSKQDKSNNLRPQDRSGSSKMQERSGSSRALERGSNSKTQERSNFKTQDRNSPKELKTAELRSKFEDSLILHSKTGNNGRSSPSIQSNESGSIADFHSMINYNDDDKPFSPRKAGVCRDFHVSSSSLAQNYYSRVSDPKISDYDERYTSSPNVSRHGSQLHLPNSRDNRWSESDRVSLASSHSSSHHKNYEPNKTEANEVDSICVSERLSLSTNSALSCVELTIQYDSTANSLHISLHRAKGLKATDINGLADPFCKLNLLPVDIQSYRLRTKTVHKTRNPEFNEFLTFYGVTESKLEKQALHILVLDDDKYGHDILGEASYQLNRLRPHVAQNLCLPLHKHFPSESDEVVWGENKWSQGRILVTLCYSTKKHALVVGIIQCVDLLPMDNNGFSDPFIKLFLKPDPHRRKFKTSVKWKNLNPVFNEEFSFETKMPDLSRQTLCLTVWDKDYGKRNDYLGCLELGCQSKGDRLKQWVDMMKCPDHKHEGWHNLCDDMISEQ